MNVSKETPRIAAKEKQQEVSDSKKDAEKHLSVAQEDEFDSFPLKSIMESESKSLSTRIPFPFDKKQKKESPLECSIGSFPMEKHVRMYAELTSKEVYLGSLYRKNGEVVFEVGNVAPEDRLLFSRESFHEALVHAAKELDGHEDYVFTESSPEPE